MARSKKRTPDEEKDMVASVVDPKLKSKNAADFDPVATETVTTVQEADGPKTKVPRKPRGSAKTAEKQVAETIVLQYSGGEWNIAEVKKRVIAAYVAEGHRQGNIKVLTLYVKPEEHMVYYVVNDKNTGCVALD